MLRTAAFRTLPCVGANALYKTSLPGLSIAQRTFSTGLTRRNEAAAGLARKDVHEKAAPGTEGLHKGAYTVHTCIQDPQLSLKRSSRIYISIFKTLDVTFLTPSAYGALADKKVSDTSIKALTHDDAVSTLPTSMMKGDWVLFHPVYSPDELRSVEVRLCGPGSLRKPTASTHCPTDNAQRSQVSFG